MSSKYGAVLPDDPVYVEDTVRITVSGPGYPCLTERRQRLKWKWAVPWFTREVLEQWMEDHGWSIFEEHILPEGPSALIITDLIVTEDMDDEEGEYVPVFIREFEDGPRYCPEDFCWLLDSDRATGGPTAPAAEFLRIAHGLRQALVEFEKMHDPTYGYGGHLLDAHIGLTKGISYFEEQARKDS